MNQSTNLAAVILEEIIQTRTDEVNKRLIISYSIYIANLTLTKHFQCQENCSKLLQS